MIEITIPGILIGVWTIFSIYYLAKAQKNPNSINTYILEAIPSVFPTIGIFCTFLGVFLGLLNFDTANIQQSIPNLLNGLKLAFIGSMLGIVGLFIFQKILAVVQKSIDSKNPTDELAALRSVRVELESMRRENIENTKLITKIFAEVVSEKVNVPMALLTQQIRELRENTNKNAQNLESAFSKLHESQKNDDNKILVELVGLRQEQGASSKKSAENTGQIISAMSSNNELIRNKFDEFSELLKKNNTEALVHVMEAATEQFNAQMKDLINRLIQENFQELNNSVKSLNEWQKENKKQIESLTNQYTVVYETFQITSNNLDNVAVNLGILTKDEGKLNQLVKELQQVMIEDGKFTQITDKITETVETLNFMTDEFKETTQKLNNWVRSQMNFTEKAEVLIVKLEEFRNLNGDVWNSYRSKMQEAVGIIKDATNKLNDNVETINGEFYERLNNTFKNLDECIQRFVPNPKR